MPKKRKTARRRPSKPQSVTTGRSRSTTVEKSRNYQAAKAFQREYYENVARGAVPSARQRLPRAVYRQDNEQKKTRLRADLDKAVFARKKRAKRKTIQPKYSLVPTDKMKFTPCVKKRERRAVLMATGKVNKPGGAPGPYKRRHPLMHPQQRCR